MRFKHAAFAALLIALSCLSAPLGAAVPDDIARHPSCAHCRMDRKAFGYSRMLVLWPDGKEVGVCSLHCAGVELDAHPGATPKSILAADRGTRAMVDAEAATWVMGGRKQGVMTRTPKWAFASKDDAESFMKDNGGTIVSWAEALGAARKESLKTP
jgi:nitrous oxide reductase accessory protein NosL